MTSETTKNIPLFSPEELDANEKGKTELINAIKNNETILFVGAGLSQTKCPSWQGLISRLEDLAKRVDSSFNIDEPLREKSTLLYVDKIKEFIKTKEGDLAKYYNELRCIFAQEECEEKHRKLFKIPFLGFITTNYDMILDKALRESEQYKGSLIHWFTLEKDAAHTDVSDFFLSLNNSLKKEKKIAHIHGTYDRPNNIILSYDDYLTSYGDVGKRFAPTLHYKFLWAILATRRVVFIGFSMSDEYINLMLNTVCKDLWRWNSESHFLITDINYNNKSSQYQNATRFSSEFAIKTIFYENNDGSHKGLEYYIDEIVDSVKIVENNILIPRMEKKVNSSLFTSDKEMPDDIKKWAKETNKKMIKKSRDNES